jgi:glycosyltransferase involved in cell wall biosynthesis
MLGHSVTVVCPKDSLWHLEARIKGRIYKHFAGKVYHAGRSPSLLRQRARAFNKQLQELSSIDYILTIFPVDAAYLKTEKPIAVIHDATWFQLLDFYPGLERSKLANESVADGYAMDLAALRKCKKAVYFSTWASTSAIRDMHCEQHKVRTIAPGANLTVRPARSQALQHLKTRSKDRCQLLFIGQEWERKGAGKAVTIAKCLNEMGTPTELNIVGCPAPENEVMPEFVRIHGFLNKNSAQDRQTIERLFASSHFFVLPTTADCTPIVLCEAAFYGLPSLSHDVGGVATIVQSGKTGQLFSLTSSPQEWAQWLRDIYADAKTYSGFAERSIEDAHARLNWESFGRELVNFLRS